MTAPQTQIEPSACSSSAEAYRCALVPAAQVPFVWEGVESMLAPAVNDPGRYTLADLYADLIAAHCSLWIVLRRHAIAAAVVTQVVEYARSKSLRIQLCGGRGMRDWLHLLPEIEQAARDLDCKHVEIRGRPGWERALPRYRRHFVQIQMEV